VVISASHNPFYDNGIKFFSADGTKLPDAVEARDRGHLDEPMGCVDSARLGKARRIDDAAGRYIEFCKSTFPNELDLRGCDRGRLRPRRGLPDRAQGVPRARRRDHAGRRRAQRPEHQRRRRRDAAGAPAPGGARTAPTSASRSTATPTA
jgi:hypothetical protein